jgi:hypothetical protein
VRCPRRLPRPELKMSACMSFLPKKRAIAQHAMARM